MAKLIGKPVLTVSATLELTESEMEALDALTIYGTDQFLAFFYKHMGRTYLEPHEEGLRSLFKTVKGAAPVVRAMAMRAREAMKP